MKKLFAAILALGLIIAVSGTASAVDVKLSGQYYVVGVYDNNPNISKNGYSTAFFYTRTRLMPTIKIAEGLTFNARIDALEKNWGNGEWTGADDTMDSRRINPVNLDPTKPIIVTNPKIQESMEWNRGWLTFATGIGSFDVGYMSDFYWGTVFGDNDNSVAQIRYTTKYGPVAFIVGYEKNSESLGNTVYATAGDADADKDTYAIGAIYSFKGGSTGLRYKYINDATMRNAATHYKTTNNYFEPYLKATFGPVYVEAELSYLTGTQKYEDGTGPGYDIDNKGISGYVMAKTAFGPATIGAQIIYASGNDPTTKDQNEAGVGGGVILSPALSLFQESFFTWSGGVCPSSAAMIGKNNALIYNVFTDYKATPKLSMGAAITYGKLNESTAAVPTVGTRGSFDKTVGTEFDVTATYKLYDNLSYMVGAGYIWAGDYFKTTATTEVDNDYILMNRIMLSF